MDKDEDSIIEIGRRVNKMFVIEQHYDSLSDDENTGDQKDSDGLKCLTMDELK